MANPRRKPRLCELPECGKRHHAKGFCKSHYSSQCWREGRDKRAPGGNLCRREGCAKVARPTGTLCEAHYRADLRANSCKHDGCRTRSRKLGYCREHEAQALLELPPGVLEQKLDRVGKSITVDPKTGCWLAPDWMPSNGGGYATFRVYRQDWLGHRFLYAVLMPPNSAESLDHLGCPDVRCIRPNHLEPVSVKVNNDRNGIRSKEPDRNWLLDDVRAHITPQLLFWAGHYGLPVAPSDAFTDDRERTLVRRS